jgi:hypothetical protein
MLWLGHLAYWMVWIFPASIALIGAWLCVTSRIGAGSLFVTSGFSASLWNLLFIDNAGVSRRRFGLYMNSIDPNDAPLAYVMSMGLGLASSVALIAGCIVLARRRV